MATDGESEWWEVTAQQDEEPLKHQLVEVFGY